MVFSLLSLKFQEEKCSNRYKGKEIFLEMGKKLGEYKLLKLASRKL
jgi:hypothetical protein